MSHFAKVENYTVLNVIVVNNENCSGGTFPDSEESGQAFIASIGLDGEWLQTSYNKNFRGQFAGKGMTYDEGLDCFHGASPYPSWVLNSDGEWDSPSPKPDGEYYWDEDNLQWTLVE